MTIFDALTVLSIFGILGFMIFAKVSRKNPELVLRMKEWFADKPEKLKEKGEDFDEYTRQKWEEKRTIM